jgi:hypothetical protein
VTNMTPGVDRQYAAVTTPASAETTIGTIDKYALPPIAAPESTNSIATSPGATYPNPNSAAAAFANSPMQGSSQTASTLQTSAPAPNPVEVTSVTTATVQLPPAGKYRPAGTSDYATTAESQRVEVAALPAAPQPASPAGASDPWPSPASATPATPATGGGIGTY